MHKHRGVLTRIKGYLLGKCTNLKNKNKTETVFDHMNEMTNKEEGNNFEESNDDS